MEPSTGSGPGVVVVLFTDIVGSTRLLGRLGDDGAEELRRDHFSLLRVVVAGTGGREVKSLGDGLMVAFTSPLDALRCAVEMQERVAEHNHGAANLLEIRIGLHAGEPVSDGSDIHGTSVVLARRLCDRATGGQILTSQLVADLVGSRGGFRFLRLGRTALKGVAEPIFTVAVQWAKRPESGPARTGVSHPARKAPRSRGPQFVGREDELGVLEAEFARVQTDEMRCVLLLGDPRVGKSRLMRGAPLCAIAGCHMGSEGEAEAVLEPVRRFGPPVLDLMGRMPYPALQQMFDVSYPAGLSLFERSDFVTDITKDVMAVHATYGPRVPTPLSVVFLYPTGGAAHRVAPHETAFAFRDAEFVHLIGAIDPDPAVTRRHSTWVRGYWSALHVHSAGGAYVNWMGDEGGDRVAATYRGNYERLRAVKARYDPGNLFHINQNVKPAEAAEVSRTLSG